MPGILPDAIENAILSHVIKGDASTIPTGARYLALATAATDSSFTEVSGGGYSRVAVTFNNPTGGTITNSSAVTFPQATANWGVIAYWGLYTASTGGTLVAWGPVSPSKTVNTGDVLQIPAGSIQLSAD